MTHWARCLFLLLLRAAGSGRLQRQKVTLIADSATLLAMQAGGP